ncbi:MAG: hypothetical protein AB1730_21990 [Myxococcota bacterium]|jgi:hypothetical protein
MKRYFGIIVAIIGVVAAIFWTMRKFERQTADAQKEQAMLKLRADYLERIAWLRNVPDEKAYKDEIGTLLRWYFKETTEILNKYGGNRKFDDYLEELESRAKKTQKVEEYTSPGKDKNEEKRAVYEYTRAVFDLMKSGNYAPYWTATDQGVRFDLLSADTIQEGGETKIHMPIVVWGLPRDERVDDKGIHRVTCNASFRFNWKLFDEKGKLLGEMPGEGGPDSRVDWPERFIKFFPPMTLLGHYDIEKLPAEVKNVEITFTISARSPTGGDMNLNYVWKLEPPAAWKLGSGETWKGAQESIRPEEEINPQGKK